MFFNDDYPLDIKTDIKEPHNYMKCNQLTNLTEYHKDTSKWDYYILKMAKHLVLQIKKI